MTDTDFYPPFIDGPQDDLRPLPSARAARPRHPDRVVEALNTLRRWRHSDRPTTEVGYCLRECREALQIGPSAPDAITAWERAKVKRTRQAHDMTRIPAGSPVFWRGGKHGHIAIAAGQHGYVFSTDILRPGYIDRVPIKTIHDRWGLDLLGYTLDLNGVTIRRTS